MPENFSRRDAIVMAGISLAVGPARPAAAQPVLATGGAIRLLARPPASVDLGALESDTDIFVFAEKQGHVLTRTIDVDISLPGDYRNARRPRDERDWSILSPGVIARGVRVDSFYFHYDNASYTDNISVRDYLRCRNQIGASGRITFMRPVLGIVMRAYRGRNDFLGRTNAELGLPGVTYCTHNFRHFPGVNIADGCGSDRFILSTDRRTLDVTNFSDVHHDNYRVVVEAG